MTSCTPTLLYPQIHQKYLFLRLKVQAIQQGYCTCSCHCLRDPPPYLHVFELASLIDKITPEVTKNVTLMNVQKADEWIWKCFRRLRKLFRVIWSHLFHTGHCLTSRYTRKTAEKYLEYVPAHLGFCLSCLVANIRPAKNPSRGYLLSYFFTKYFLPMLALNMTFWYGYAGISWFANFPHFAKLHWKSLTNLRKKRKMLFRKFSAWCPKILFYLKTHIF